MKNRTWKGIYILIVLLCFMVSGVFTGAAFAATAPEEGNLTIRLINGGVNIPGANFKLYHVADVAGNGEISLIDELAHNSVDIPKSGGTAGEWDGFAKTMTGYVAADNIAIEASGTTNAAGTLHFDGLNQSGRQKIYLLVGDPCTFNGYTYIIQPSMLAVPGWSSADGWYTDVTVYPKSEKQTTEREVVKVWRDAGNEANRPEFITVDLVDATGAESVVYDTVKLSADNNWHHKWEDLAEERNWQIVERDVAPGYTVTIEVRDGITYIINSLRSGGDNPPDNPPKDPQNPPNDSPNPPEEELPDDPTPLGALELPDPAGDEPELELPDPEVPLAMLPHTGVLWWPVPIMAMAGMVMLLLGLVLRRQEQM